MNAMPTYVLDANVFIQAARRYYAFDIAPRFWEALVEYAERGRLISIDRVKVELDRGKDELTQWANGRFQQRFRPTNRDDVLIVYRQIMQWSQSQHQFAAEARADFADGDNADAWLVAFAHADGKIIVTHEEYDQYVRRKIPIPNACQPFKVRCVDTFQMLRELGIRLG